MARRTRTIRTIMVTGAGSGFGKGTALELASRYGRSSSTSRTSLTGARSPAAASTFSSTTPPSVNPERSPKCRSIASLKPFNIHVALIEPGAFATGFNEAQIATKYAWMKPDSGRAEPSDRRHVIDD